MEKLKILLALLPASSVFLWAFFDITWWAELGELDPRTFMVMLLHAFGVVFGGVYIAGKSGAKF